MISGRVNPRVTSSSTRRPHPGGDALQALASSAGVTRWAPKGDPAVFAGWVELVYMEDSQGCGGEHGMVGGRCSILLAEKKEGADMSSQPFTHLQRSRPASLITFR